MSDFSNNDCVLENVEKWKNVCSERLSTIFNLFRIRLCHKAFRNAGISSQNFLTFSFDLFATLQ